MSRTHQALQKAEAEQQQAQHRAFDHFSLRGRSAPEIEWDLGTPSFVEYQKIRVWLTNPATRGQLLQTVMVVSCHAGTGSTTTAALLASTMAEGKRSRVLIIDGNFRTPSLNMIFDVRNNGGLTEVLSAGLPLDAHIQPTTRQNLYVLTSGQISRYAAETFEGDAVNQLLSQLKEKFDFIIFDAAPVLEFPDSYALAPKVDSIILVVEADKTPIEEAQRAKRNLEQAGGRILGVVLNRKKDYTPPFLRKLLHLPS